MTYSAYLDVTYHTGREHRIWVPDAGHFLTHWRVAADAHMDILLDALRIDNGLSVPLLIASKGICNATTSLLKPGNGADMEYVRKLMASPQWGASRLNTVNFLENFTRNSMERDTKK
jgi:hypothetical protein